MASLIIIFAASVVIIVGLRALARRSYVKDRKPVSLTEMHALVGDQVSLDVFIEVWLKIGEAFTVDPRLIRPTDTLLGFGKIDSWDLGEGEISISLWLEQKELGTMPYLQTSRPHGFWCDTNS